MNKKKKWAREQGKLLIDASKETTPLDGIAKCFDANFRPRSLRQELLNLRVRPKIVPTSPFCKRHAIIVYDTIQKLADRSETNKMLIVLPLFTSPHSRCEETHVIGRRQIVLQYTAQEFDITRYQVTVECGLDWQASYLIDESISECFVGIEVQLPSV